MVKKAAKRLNKADSTVNRARWHYFPLTDHEQLFLLSVKAKLISNKMHCGVVNSILTNAV